MSDPTLLAFEIAEAKKAREAQKFNLNPSSLEQARKGLFGSTFFDIETAGLDPKGQVYESGFLSTSPTGEETYRQSFYKSDTDKFSGFTKRTIGSRAVPEGADLNKAISSSSVGQEGFADHFKTITPGTDVWVHNLNFESRFLGERIGKEDFVGWAQSNKLESYSDYSPRLFETNMGVKKAVGAAEGLSYTSRGTLDEYLKAQEDVFSAYRSAFIDTPRPAGVTRVADSMTLARAVFGLAQSRGVMAKTGEVFAGTSIESMADAAFGLSERHTALGDAALQKGMVEFLFATGIDLQDGRELTEQQRSFFKRIELNQQKIKQESAVKTIVDAFNNQQRYAVEKDPELLKGVRTDVGSRSSKLTVSSLDPETGAYNKEIVPTFRRAPFDADNTTLDIDEFVESRKKASTSRYGLTPDWDKALEDAKRGYIDPFNEAVLRPKRDLGAPLTPEVEGPRISASNALSQSYTPEEIIKRTLTEFEPRADAIKRLAPPDLSIFQQGKKFLGDNWKVAAGVGLGLALLSRFSGKDDEYNYLEGLKHQGFAGETRRYNTDFGSGIQNFFRAASQRSGKVRSFRPSVKTVAGLAEGTRAVSPSRIKPVKTLKAAQPERDDILGRIARIKKIGLQNEYQSSALDELSDFVRQAGGIKADWSPDRILGGHGFNAQTGPLYQRMGLAVSSGPGSFTPSRIGYYFNIEKTRFGGARTIDNILSDLNFVARRDSPIGKALPRRQEAYKKTAENIIQYRGSDPYKNKVSRIIGELSQNESRAASFDLSSFLKGEEGWRAHSTKKSGIEGIIATNRILPGGTNAYHNPGEVGVYASALSGDIKHIDQVEAAKYGEHTILIPPRTDADFEFRTSGPHEVTRNAGLKIKGLKKIGQDVDYTHHVDYDWIYSNIREADSSYQKLSFKKNWLQNSPELPLKKRLKMAYEISDLESAFKPNLELAEAEAKKGWDSRHSIPSENSRTYYTFDDAERIRYNPDHRARPTKIISEEGGSSLAFGHAEQLGLSHPEAAGAMDGVFNVAKEIEALGGQLHIKGGVAREKLVSMIRPEWARKSKDIDLLVTGDVPTDKVYAAMEKHQAFFDVQTTSTLDHFFPTTDSSLNQAVIRVGGDRSEQLIATKGAIEDAFLGRQRYLDFADPSRAKQRIEKLEGNYPGLTTTKGEIPEMNQPYAIISGNDDVYNTIEGLRHQGVAGANRKNNTAFGSGWQGLQQYDIRSLFSFMNQNNHNIVQDPNDGLSKRANDDRQVAQAGISSYRVEDADTVKLMLKGGGEMNLRLAGIDAPETTHEGYGYNPLQDQPYGQEATSRLEDLLAQQNSLKVLFSPDGSDTYGRTAGLLVADDGTNINLELVRAGAAAALPYGPSNERLYSTGAFAKAQEEAIQSGEGMWAQDEWLAAQRAMSNKQRLTHATLADPQDIYQNFRAAAVLHRMKNPDAALSQMMAAGGKDDFNIHEGLRHGWANANRRADIGDFGSGYVIDKVVRRPARSFALKTKLMNAHRDARSYVKSMFDNENHIGHHRS